MKNIRILILGLISTVGIISSIGAVSLKPYLISPFKDEKGKTIAHIMAENSDRMPEFNIQLIQECKKLGVDEVRMLSSAKDNDGKTALDIAKEKVEETQGNEHAVDCLKFFIELEVITLNELSASIHNSTVNFAKKYEDSSKRESDDYATELEELIRDREHYDSREKLSLAKLNESNAILTKLGKSPMIVTK